MNKINIKIFFLSILLLGFIYLFYNINILKNFYLYKNIKNLYKYMKKKNWIKQIKFSFFTILFIFIIRLFIYEPFYILSDSMMPTLLSGDLILVNKFIYGIKNPLNNKYIIKNKFPKRGDIVVFKFPKNVKTKYIKRIIGLPGDFIFYDQKNKQIILYSKKHIKKNIIKYNNLQKSNFFHIFIKDRKKFYDFKKNLIKHHYFGKLRFFQYTENINKLSHKILFLPEIQNEFLKIYKQKNFPKYTWLVPNQCYFVMGDNRDKSYDSRYWGFVNKKYLLGKAIFIWFSIGKNTNTKFIKIRFNRIHKIN
ncbi:signal peptidase I [Enterobacteriaceae endosymbiont of Donacia semicuprea]|uniref:signal peptidase I n=1 Tax=Enterobacteriaceae endosymbiont of Donacia semicuprea TaxID=2675783 RepID=UPI0014498C2E|nr:signal peptidase I [Enterobacteriaceae endosymbiont of Donacia semicuprea]QJC32844.1 signal peptidase I [Enterobacteriaceae endosymbiont of Donacia semicuprea]